MKRKRQLSLGLRRARKKRLGRPPGTGRRPVAHRERERFVRRCVVHVRLRVREDVPRLRQPKYARALRGAFTKGCLRAGFSLCQFSIQGNHLHLVCEADNHEALARGMQGFGVRAAKAINRAAGRRGSVFAERYAMTRVTSARQLRNTLCYVLNNARRHGAKFLGADFFSSARHFDGFSTRVRLPEAETDSVPVAPAKTQLLRKRWRFLGLIDPDETPAPRG